MANRKLPFGYEMRHGTVCVKASEGPIVREIYAAYSGGMSYSQIVDSLNSQAVPYCEPGKPWNKNMIARILSNELYTGKESYPAILTTEEYRCAASAKPATGAPLDTRAKAVRQLARCAVCGSALALSGNRYGWARWNCPSCGAISEDAVMPDTIDALSQILAAAIKNPGLVQIPLQPEESMPSVPEQLETEFNTAIQAEELDRKSTRLNSSH